MSNDKDDIVVIFDIDGTVANCDHRLHHLDRKDEFGRKRKRRFDLFEKEIPYDSPILPVINIYKRFVDDPNVTVILLTGRNEKTRADTEKWFTDHGLDGYDALYMKSREKYSEPDTTQKAEQYEEIVAKYGPVAMVFEDRGRMITKWREMGVFVLDVNQIHMPSDKDSGWRK